MAQIEKSLSIQNKNIYSVFGQFDENIKKIEKAFSVKVVNRGDIIKITGEEDNAAKASETLISLNKIASKGEVTVQSVNYVISEVGEKTLGNVTDLVDDYVCMTVSGRKVAPKTHGQKKYIDACRKNTIVFGVGPAGTGKTYLAMAMAITAFKNNEVSRIILTRPAIEAGEKLGFLPGDMQQKVDPYLRPLYDALYEIMGADSYLKNVEKGAIEVAPLAYMRGRTLEKSYIILDEAQNATPEQMKMFLTRIGFGSKMIITGDITQIDLPHGKDSGLISAINILQDIEGISICTLTNKDVVRHPLVQKIIQAYEKFDK